MAIIAECYDCGREYKLPDSKAGRRVRCKNCGAAIDVPDEFAVPQRKTSSKKRKSSRSSNSDAGKIALVAGGLVVGILVVGVVAYFLTSMLNSGNGQAEVASSSAPVSSTGKPVITPADLSEADKAKRDEAYKADLERQRLNNSKSEKENLVRQYGADKVISVTFTNVVGDTDAARKYLQRKVFRAAYKDYSDGQARANQATEANREAAEKQALDQQGGGFGMVWYQYKQVRSDVPYPRVTSGVRDGNDMIFHAGPALNSQKFANRIGIGNVTNADGRDVNIAVNLPTPIPDPDVEELIIAHGEEKVVTLKIEGAQGDPKAIEMYLIEETRKATDTPNFKSVNFQSLGNGAYEFTVGPVDYPQAFIERLGWAEMVSFEEQPNVAKLQAKLPADLPSFAELTAAKKAQADLEKAIRDADWNKVPRPNETELDWAIRIVKDNETFTRDKALKALALMEVDEERREEVAKVLAFHATGQTHGAGLEALLPAILQWKTEDTEKLVLSMGGRSNTLSSSNRNALMNALVELGTEPCAVALASGLSDFFAGEDSVRYLIEIGPIAEEPVLEYLKNNDKRVRTRVYTVLSEIGTQKSLTKLKTNIKLEKEDDLKALAQSCYDEVKERVDAAESAPAKPAE